MPLEKPSQRIVVGSITLAVICLVIFATSRSPDRGLFLMPLFFLGFPTTILGNLLFVIYDRSLWPWAIGLTVTFLTQWFYVAWRQYQKGR